jgi:ParB-like chromosome segregation protein Spo0J
MTPYRQIRRIPLSQIDFKDTTFRLVPFTENYEAPGLRESIAGVGLLHPPIIQENFTGSFLIVAGRKRLHILRDSLAAKDCACIILPQDTDQITVFSILLEEKLLKGPLTPVEKAVFFTHILLVSDIDQAAQQFLPRLGLSTSPYHIQKMLALLDLEDQILKDLHNGLLSEKTAHELTRLSFRDRLALFETIKQLQLSIGKQQKLLLTCRELSGRTRTAIGDILSCAEVHAILNHPQSNPPQKSTNLMTWLSQKRFPRLSAAERKFAEFNTTLNLPPGAVLSHSLSFEKDAITLSLLFKNEKDFLKSWQKMKTCFTNEQPPQ